MRIDLVVVMIIYFVMLMGIAFYFCFKIKDCEGYYVAGRNIPPWALFLTFIGTHYSAGAFVGYTGITYTFGLPIFLSWPPLAFGLFLAWAILGPRLHAASKRLKALTIPDYVDDRFRSKAVTILFAANMIFWLIPMAVAQFRAAGLLVESITGIDYHYCILIFGVLVMLYTMMGGMFGVVYTDALQAFLMIAAFLAFIPVTLMAVEGAQGLQEYYSINPAGASMLPPAGAPLTLTFLIPWILMSFFGAASSPHFVLRFFFVESAKSIKKMAPWVVLTGAVLGGFATQIMGLSGRVLFPELPTADLAAIYLVRDLFPGIIAGIMMAAVTAAMMSTLDSILVTSASTVENDLYTRYTGKTLSQRARVFFARVVVLILGVIIVVWALNPPDLLALLFYPAWGALGFLSAFLFYGGLFWKRMNWQGALVAVTIAPISILLWQVSGRPFGLEPILPGIILTIPIFFLVTYLTPPSPKEILENYFTKQVTEDRTA